MNSEINGFMLMGGRHAGGGWWVVFGKIRKFRIDWGAYYDVDGWRVKQTRLCTWNRNSDPLKFRTKIFTL